MKNDTRKVEPVVVPTLTGIATTIAWVPIEEVDDFLERFPESEEMFKHLMSLGSSDRGGYLHDFGTRLLVRAKTYDNVGRTTRYSIVGDIVIATGDTEVPNDKDSETPFLVKDANEFQKFSKEYYVSIFNTWEVTHFAFIIVI